MNPPICSPGSLGISLRSSSYLVPCIQACPINYLAVDSVSIVSFGCDLVVEQNGNSLIQESGIYFWRTVSLTWDKSI